MDMLTAGIRTRRRGLRGYYGVAVVLAITTLVTQGVATAARYNPMRSSAVGGWHVAARVQVAGHSVILTAIDAVSAKDAWLSGLAINRKGTGGQPLIERWKRPGFHHSGDGARRSWRILGDQ